MYYNTLANFYLCFNSFVPYYDDVIISLSITSFKNIINNNLNLKSIKQNRMMQLLYSLNDKDKIIVDDDGYIIIYYDKDAKICAADAEEHEATEDDAEDDVEDADEALPSNPEEVAFKPDASPSNPEEVAFKPDALPSNPEEVAFEPETIPSNPEEVAFEPETIPSNPEEVAFKPDALPSNPEEDADAISEPYNSSDKKNN
jgi:hypothetical protein